MTNLRDVDVSFQDSLFISEFAELRTASPANRADVEFLYDKQPLLMDDISSGGGTATHQVNSRDIILAVVNTTLGTTAGMRQHYWTPYTPGSGQEIDITGVLDFAAIGGGTLAAFLRSTVTGTTTVQTVAQAAWEAKTTGVDVSKSQIFRMSFQSLRVGRIQYALVSGGMPTKVCEITNDNVRNTGYWQYANLPPYWKVYNDADNTVVEFGYGDELNGIGFSYTFNGLKSTATAIAICETVKSQGGDKLFDMPGFPFSTLPMTGTGIAVAAAYVPVISIRVTSTFNSIANRTLIIPESYSIETTNPIHYVILYRPTLTGASWAPVDATYSGVEYDISATAFSGGVRVDGDMLGAGQNARTITRGSLGKTVMALGSTGVSDILSIVAIRSTASSATVSGLWKWREIR